MENVFKLDYNGQQVQKADFELIGEVAGLADDRVFAELFRMTPYDGSTVSKGVLPYVDRTNAFVGTDGPTGKVRVYPFRAFVGSRTEESTDADENWRDVRSAVAVGSTTLEQTVTVSANSSGNPRWDLVYAAVAIDADAASTLRKVKDPTTKVVTEETVATSMVTTVALGITTGTPAASPSWPSIPTDSGSTYYIPLAYIRVPDGFNASATVLQTGIAEVAPVIRPSLSVGASSVEVADQHYSTAGEQITSSVIQAWGASGTRPNIWLPPTMTGSETLLLYVDLNTPRHVRNSVLDSRNWRNRICRWTIAIGQSVDGAAPWMGGLSAPNAENVRPSASDNTTDVLTGLGQTFTEDNGLEAGEDGGFVALIDGTESANLLDATEVGIWCDFNDDGKLKFHTSVADPAVSCFLFCWLEFTAPFVNAGV